MGHPDLEILLHTIYKCWSDSSKRGTNYTKMIIISTLQTLFLEKVKQIGMINDNEEYDKLSNNIPQHIKDEQTEKNYLKQIKDNPKLLAIYYHEDFIKLITRASEPTDIINILNMYYILFNKFGLEITPREIKTRISNALIPKEKERHKETEPPKPGVVIPFSEIRKK